ncbi:hypothetical protein BDW68DRAFT_177510 [Aspergillus falconensis]
MVACNPKKSGDGLYEPASGLNPLPSIRMRHYIVQSADNCVDIAAKSLDISYQQIVAWSPTINTYCTDLRVDQKQLIKESRKYVVVSNKKFWDRASIKYIYTYFKLYLRTSKGRGYG